MAILRRPLPSPHTPPPPTHPLPYPLKDHELEKYEYYFIQNNVLWLILQSVRLTHRNMLPDIY